MQNKRIIFIFSGMCDEASLSSSLYPRGCRITMSLHTFHLLPALVGSDQVENNNTFARYICSDISLRLFLSTYFINLFTPLVSFSALESNISTNKNILNYISFFI